MKKAPPSISPHLLWEYDLFQFNWDEMKVLVVQRVIQIGWPKDWKAMMDYYGHDEVRDIIKKIPHLYPSDITYVCTIFDLQPDELLCYRNKQLKTAHWI